MAELGPPPLNIQPQGLLSFFGIKNGGRNPQTLMPTLQPTTDLYQHYLQTQALRLGLTFNSSAANSNAGVGFPLTNTLIPAMDALIVGGELVVPQNEWWILLRVALRIIFSANAGISGGMYLYFLGETQTEQPLRVVGTSNATVSSLFVEHLTLNAWLPPGTRIGAGSTGNIVPAGQIANNGSMTLCRLQV